MNEILEEVRLSYTGDAFGQVQGWRFGIANYLHFDLDEPVFGFSPSPLGVGRSYERDCLLEMRATEDECRYALKILDRAREILGAEGMDY